MARPRVHDEHLATRLVEATSAVLAERGAPGVTVREVAGLAGTSASAVYSLFGSREALVSAVAAEAVRRFEAHLSAVRVGPDPMADLFELGLAYRRSALADPHFYRVMFGPAARPDAASAVSRPAFRVLLAAGERTGTDQPLDPALGLWALAHGLVTPELAGLLPGGEPERSARYRDALAACGPALVGSAPLRRA
ncbi:MAG TPA: TetR/AcrR family transcriptional regulator [Actinotalea sp.]|nr:TetR/AcrR family transcriptional regulator [Actinotalea sp.]